MRFIFPALLLLVFQAKAHYGNYNSILIGDRAAGMGGAFTALTNDPSACSFYNPASLARMRGSSLSASMSLYNKYDTVYSDKSEEFINGTLRVNQGAFKPVASARGIFSGFGPFAVGISFINPDSLFYSEEVKATKTSASIINVRDESSWTGLSFALNLTRDSAIGITAYYTARDFSRSIIDQTASAAQVSISTEEKTFTSNSVLYILGYYQQINDHWVFGSSFRFPSIEVSGKGTFLRTTVIQNGNSPTPIQNSKVASETKVPLNIRTGLSYTQPKRYSLSLDVQYYGAEDYYDIDIKGVADHIIHRPIFNVSLGAEYYWEKWLLLRAGIFSNFSSFERIPDKPYERMGDHIDMMGFSVNFAIFTSDEISYTIGGYYTGGQGHAVEQFETSLIRVPKTQQIFSLMIGSSYHF